MSLEKRLEALEKSQGGGYVFVDRVLEEREEAALARHTAERGEEPEGTVIFMGPGDWEL